MHRLIVSLIVLACVAVTATEARHLPGYDFSTGAVREIKGQFIIRFSDDATPARFEKSRTTNQTGVPAVDAVLEEFSAREVRPLFGPGPYAQPHMDRFFVVRLSEDSDDGEFKRRIGQQQSVVTVENDKECEVALTPNDPNHSQQWSTYNSSPVQVHSAWDIETGIDTAIIAIIDVGVLYSHPDLINNIWINPAEDIDNDNMVFDSTDLNMVDNGGNGYTDDLVGFDFFTGGSNPTWPGEDGSVTDNDPKDFNGHGTNCAGIAAAASNNVIGGAGMAGGAGPYAFNRGAQIMCLRAGYSGVHPTFGYETGYLVMSSVLEAINYAVNNGADVISYSAGSSVISGMATALSAAMSAGVVFCNAAGNDNTSSSASTYFGTYPGIITVAATNPSDGKAGYSNYGAWVEVCAPGDNIWNTSSYHYIPTYDAYWGTSMAAPMVAGLAGLIKSHFPTYDKTQIDPLILNNADNIDAINPDYAGQLGSGRINAYQSLQSSPVAKFSSTNRIGPVPLTVNFLDQSPSPISWAWDFGDGGNSTQQNPSHQYMNPGLYTVSQTVTDPNGTHASIKKQYVMVTADTLYGNLVDAPGGQSFAVPFRLKNSIPLEEIILAVAWPISGSPTLNYDSFTVSGTRAAGFGQAEWIDQASGKLVIKMRPNRDLWNTGRNLLAPGDGEIIRFWFTLNSTGGLTSLDTTSLNGLTTTLRSRYGEYVPVVFSVPVKIKKRGDANNDFLVNIADAVYLINHIFKSGQAPDSFQGDANGDTSVNIADAVFLINHIFKGGPPPPAG